MPKARTLRADLMPLAAVLFASGLVVAPLAKGQPSSSHPISNSSTLIQRVAVFGSDDRRDLPPAYQSIARKIGALTDLRTRSQCTAFCLSENVVATAAHCLFRTRNEARPDLRNFRFKLHGQPDKASSRIAGTQSPAAVPNIASGSMSLSIRPPIEATRDWAIVRLDAPACTAGGLPISPRSAEDLTQDTAIQPLYQVGYHRDFPGDRLAFASPCKVSRSFALADRKAITSDFSNADQLILHSCDTGGASSGSPLLVDGPNGPEVAGINVGTYVQSRILTLNGAVSHRYQSENVANTGVSSGAFQDAWKHFEQTTFLVVRADMRELQVLLKSVGVYDGPLNGLYGLQSRAAIERFEQLEGRPVTGLATEATLQTLRASKLAKAPQQKVPSAKPIETGSVTGIGLTSSAKSKPAH
jgi:hypothetical protein